MAVFNYRAKNKKGKLVEGLVDASSQEEVANLLLEKNLTIVEIRAQKMEQAGSFWHFIFKRVKVKDLVVFFRQLSVMMDAQLPLVKALKLVARQTESEHFRLVVMSLTEEVDGGSKLSAAMRNFPDIFSNFYINIILSGETSGRLSQVMSYLADQQEKDYDLQSKIKGAMIYPAFILSGLVVVGFVVMTFVVPKMTEMLADSGAAMPFITRAFIGIAGFFNHWWWLMLILAFLAALGCRYYVRTAEGRRQYDLLKIKAPIFGSIFKKIYIVRICRSFGTLLTGGVPAAQALETVRGVVDNKIYEELIAQAVKDVEEGGAIAESLSKSPYMPSMVPQMISIGEEAGRLDDVLDKITSFYSREIENSVANLSTLIEPLIMVILGLAVGLFVAAIILPMWQLSASFS